MALAEALGKLGRGFGERLSLLDRAVTIRELSVGRDKDQDAGFRGVVLQACAECYEEAGHFDEAEERWATCVAAFEKVRIRKRLSLTMNINTFGSFSVSFLEPSVRNSSLLPSSIGYRSRPSSDTFSRCLARSCEGQEGSSARRCPCLIESFRCRSAWHGSSTGRDVKSATVTAIVGG